jgi:hypothetical protein
MGSGGYPTVIPKWEKAEQELIDRGESIGWPQHAKHWFFAHGGSLDPEIRKVVYGKKPNYSRKISSRSLHRSK